MNTPAPGTPLSDLIAAAGGALTHTDRRIAAAVLADETLLAFGTVTDLANAVDTSRPSIVRFATKLGFDGYTHLQEHVQAGLAKQLSRPSQRIRRSDPASSSAGAAFEEGINSVLRAMDGDSLDALAQPVVDAETVWILSGETSQAGARALFTRLSIIRPGVRLLEEHTRTHDLIGAGSRDAAVIIDFARYRKQAMTLAHALAELGVTIVAITDGPLSPLATIASARCDLTIPAVGAFDSSVPTVAAAELLAARVARKLHKTALERIDEIEALWKATDNFLP